MLLAGFNYEAGPKNMTPVQSAYAAAVQSANESLLSELTTLKQSNTVLGNCKKALADAKKALNKTIAPPAVDLGPVLKGIKELDTQVRANTKQLSEKVDDLNGKVELLQVHVVRLMQQQQQQQVLPAVSMYAPPSPFGMVYPPPPPQPTLRHAGGNGNGKRRAVRQARSGSKKTRLQQEDDEEEVEEDAHPMGCKCRACKHVRGCQCEDCK